MTETKNVFISHVHKDDHGLQRLKDLGVALKLIPHATCLPESGMPLSGSPTSVR